MDLKHRTKLILDTADPVTGKLPSHRDIMQRTGTRASSVVHEALNTLERDGRIRRTRGANGTVLQGTAYLVDQNWQTVPIRGTLDATGIHLD